MRPQVGDDLTIALDQNYNPIVRKIISIGHWDVVRDCENNQVMVYRITTDDGLNHLWPNLTYHPAGTIRPVAKLRTFDRLKLITMVLSQRGTAEELLTRIKRVIQNAPIVE